MGGIYHFTVISITDSFFSLFLKMQSCPYDGYPKVSSKNFFPYVQEERACSCTAVFPQQNVVNSSQNSPCASAMQLLLVFLALCTQEAALVPLLRDLHSEGLNEG